MSHFQNDKKAYKRTYTYYRKFHKRESFPWVSITDMIDSIGYCPLGYRLNIENWQWIEKKQPIVNSENHRSSFTISRPLFEKVCSYAQSKKYFYNGRLNVSYAIGELLEKALGQEN